MSFGRPQRQYDGKTTAGGSDDQHACAVIAIAPPGPDGQTGNRQTGISLQTDDIDAVHAELKQAGVDVDADVSRMGDPVPPMFWLRDPEGNVLLIAEVK